MQSPASHIVLIGGSAGSYNLIVDILEALPLSFSFAICVVLHRNANFKSRIEANLASKLNKQILSIVDKMDIRSNHVYFAPPGYHILVEPNYIFSLDASEPVNFSIPSIDVVFESCAQVFKKKCTAFLLSGASVDGTNGLKAVISFGGQGFVQSPRDAQMDIMPQHAINTVDGLTVLKNKEIISYFCHAN